MGCIVNFHASFPTQVGDSILAYLIISDNLTAYPHPLCRSMPVIIAFFAMACCVGCQREIPDAANEIKDISSTCHFTSLTAEETGVDFINTITEDYNYNIFTYEYLYNGCGIGAGDLNGDSLPDLYFASAFGLNKLYINLGDFRFKEVTALAGVEGKEGYKTGVALADINGDGRLDIHCCRTSKSDDGKKTDFVFINRGNKRIDGIDVPIFEDMAKALGLDDNSNTNHACYFDFDNDGDLDVFLLNHRVDFADATRIRAQQNEDGSIRRILTPTTPFESNKFYLNQNGKFTDITAKAGLVSAAFGLSISAADINQDGWMDLYVANDYIEPDYVYINNMDGTFTDHYSDYLKHSSQNSMGADIADINNDGLPDIIVLDMKAEDHIRYKELVNVMQLDRYNLLVQYGYGRQQGRNILQLNNGNSTFSEIGQFSGISSTDWSWAPLIADFDNDGWRDIYITNGYRKDVTNLDYLNFFRDSIAKSGGLSSSRFPDIEDFIKHIPDQKISNYLYVNTGNLSFDNHTKMAGLYLPSFSTGAACADFDLDGDMDIVVNNLNDPAFIYRNELTAHHWLQIAANAGGGNTNGIGTTVDVYAGSLHVHDMILPTKGFLSTSEPILHFGLGVHTTIDSIILEWPNGELEILRNIEGNQRMYWKKGTGKSISKRKQVATLPLFKTMANEIEWKHEEQPYNDFKREKLLPFMLSAMGPALVVGDINLDGRQDLFVGNGAGFPSDILLQDEEGRFKATNSQVFMQDKFFEDCAAVLEDFDLDGDLDLIVASGGNEDKAESASYFVRYYRNDGKGNLSRDSSFPNIKTNAGAICAVDIDHDQDLDIIIGGQSLPGRYPQADKSYCLLNNSGTFEDVTSTLFPDLETLGMVTAIEAADLDGDGQQELVIAGDFMPITIFSFNGKTMRNRSADFGMPVWHGWWKSMCIVDIDGDGDQDIVAGNIGLNNRFHASVREPIVLIANDFDNNGSIDPILTYYQDGRQYPYAGRDAMIGQLPGLKKKFLRYAPYARATIEDIFSEDDLKQSQYLYVHTLSTTLFINEGKSFSPVTLPFQSQLSPVYAILVEDYDLDGRKDILLAGNFLYAEPETGEMDAGCGVLLTQMEDGTFRYIPNRNHGFWAQQEVRTLLKVKLANEHNAIVTGNNKGNIELNLILK